MRRIMRAFSLWMMTGMALAGLHVQAQQCTIRQLPHAESFADTTRATCWHVLDADGVAENNWARVTDGGHGDNFSMKSLQGMPSDDWLVSPAIVVPLEGGNNLRLQWWVSAEAFYDIMPATYEVRVSTTDDTSTAMFSDSLFSETYAGEWVQRSLSLGGYAGQTIYVAFRNVSFLATSLSIDDVNLSIANDPVFEIDGPTLTILPDSAFFTARRVEGDTVGISYVWSSRMASARRANMNTRGSLLEMQYLQVGTDTITLTVQNQYGRSSVQHYVRVIECPTIATVPHFEGFEESVECWRVVSGNGTDADNWRQYFDTTMAHEGSGAMLSVYMGTQMPTEDMDEWLISPAFAIPQEVNGLVCSYYVLGASFMGSASQYEVRLSNGSARPEDFTTVLLTDSLATGYVQRNISLSEYAGRTVRFAFRNMTPLDGYLLAIDNFELRYALEPIYSLSGVSTIEVGADAGITANRIEGDTANLSFTWSSTMAAAGMATLTPQRDTLRVVYSQAGLDTITCVIRNGHGTTTLTHTLRAFSCEARTSIPYTESFEGDLDCWKIFSANTASDDDWEVYTDRQFAHSGRKMLLSYFSSDSVAADEWIVSPTFTLPDSAYGLVLSFYARGRNANGVNTAYEVRMSESTGLQPSDFDTLLLADEPSNTYVQHRINLEPYAGRTVRFAFRNVTPASTGAYLLIDDVAIRYANEPVYTLAGTTNIREGDTASFAATRVEGNTVGLQFAWSSTMAAAGNAQWVETADSSSSIIYSAAGNDTITLIVSNGYGSDTLTHSVRVYSCQPRAVYPYVEGFESQLDCWTFVNANEWNVDG
ncbi:MAG: choice-of-anchor J domain-containing protein [Bacteroidales bacterium]|nr:choice-of-anchor J domain-containing protein [Bacteroidales bacterium]